MSHSSVSTGPAHAGAFLLWYNLHMSRFVKQLIFGAIFLVIIGVSAWFLYRTLVPAPSCTDGIQNGSEEGVDCGAICGISCAPAIQPLTQAAPIIIKTGPASADIIVRLNNPNSIYGASRIDYTLVVDDAGGQQLLSRRGNTYVNPMQPRYLLFPLTGLSGVPASAQLQFAPTDVQWATLAVQAASDVQLTVQSDDFIQESGSARYSATVVNRSTFTFDTVDVTVLVRDDAGEVVGANATVLRTLAPQEQRAFVLAWPFAIPGATRAEAVVTTNVFTNANFIKTYGSPERFQGY